MLIIKLNSFKDKSINWFEITGFELSDSTLIIYTHFNEENRFDLQNIASEDIEQTNQLLLNSFTTT
ncbi:hypothetical protein R9C00_07815 [Flammeovirgaceae bacterium SG7u.111]|nr:hypothetical protein [Flammeovirgaceae bacterium SG7u.132]WPO37353.1 hypothetical protein R9C00_07815 [Flammeovirgaceae bacterium SG7u.111]